MAFHWNALMVNAFAVATFAVISALCQSPEVFIVLFALWIVFTTRLVSAHGKRVLVRSWGTNASSLREGSFLTVFPEYVVQDHDEFGPWKQRKCLPSVGQVIDVDVPEVLVPLDQGLYCLKVNTKVIGVVEHYGTDDLAQNPVAIEHRCHDVIAQALRKAVLDKPLEEAFSTIQRMFLKDADMISSMLSVPTFRARELLLDADQCISPADAATTRALELILQRKEEVAKRTALEAAMETEEQKVKLQKISLQSTRNEFMLQQEAYGKEGAALIEAAKHTKALYLFAGGSGLNASTVLTLPS